MARITAIAALLLLSACASDDPLSPRYAPDYGVEVYRMSDAEMQARHEEAIRRLEQQ